MKPEHPALHAVLFRVEPRMSRRRRRYRRTAAHCIRIEQDARGVAAEAAGDAGFHLQHFGIGHALDAGALERIAQCGAVVQGEHAERAVRRQQRLE